MSRPTKSIQTYRQYNLSKPKTPDYENLDEGDYLLIPAEKFVSPQYICVSGNTIFDDLDELDEGARFVSELPPIPKGKYVVVKFIEIQEH